MHTLRIALLVSALFALGCQSFHIDTPPDFVEREEADWSSFAFRAINADAVVLGVREVEEEKEASLAFWTKAVKNRLQASHAYALLGEETVSTKGGHSATLLKLGREDAGVQYAYWVALVDANERLFVVEAGGRQDAFTKVEESILGSLKSFDVQ